MAFRIELARHAELDIAEAVNYIAEDSPLQAARWFNGLFLVLEALREFPARNPLIREATNLGRELRSVRHHSHRVIYEIQEAKNTIYIVRVYYSARKPLSRKDFQ